MTRPIASTPPHAVPADDRDFAGVYRACAGFHLTAGLLAIADSGLQPDLRRRERILGVGGGLAAVAAGGWGLARPHALARFVRRRPATTALAGIVSPAAILTVTGRGRSPLAFEAAVLAGTGAGVVGTRNGVAYGSCAAASAALGVAPQLLRGDARRARELGGVLGLVIGSCFSAGPLGSLWGEASLRLHALHETVDREEARAERLRELTSAVRDLLDDNRVLTRAVARWSLAEADSAVDRATIAEETDRQYAAVQQLVAAAQQRAVEPDQLKATLTDIVAQWGRHGLAERAVRVEIDVEDDVLGAVDDRLASGIVLVVTRALQNVLRWAEVATCVSVRVTRRSDDWVEVVVADDGAGTLPDTLGGGLMMLRLRFERELEGTFDVRETAEGVAVTAAAPIRRAPRPALLQPPLSESARVRRDLDRSLTLLSLTTGFQAVATGVLDRPKRLDRTRAVALSIGPVALGQLIGLLGRSLRAVAPAAWPARVALGTVATLALPFTSARPPLSGWVEAQLAGLAFDRGVRPALVGQLAHTATSWRAARFPWRRATRRKLRWTSEVLGSSAMMWGAGALARRWLAATARREAVVGCAADRAHLAEDLYDVLERKHDLTGDLARLDPLLPASFVAQRIRQQGRFERLRTELERFAREQPPIGDAIRRVVAWRIAPAPAVVDVGGLPDLSDAPPSVLVAAHRDRSGLVDLVSETVEELLTEYPLSLLGRRKLRRLRVVLRASGDDLVLSFVPVPAGGKSGGMEIGRLVRHAASLSAVIDGDFRDGRISFLFVGGGRVIHA